jgi:hypothetical protein
MEIITWRDLEDECVWREGWRSRPQPKYATRRHWGRYRATGHPIGPVLEVKTRWTGNATGCAGLSRIRFEVSRMVQPE